MINPWLTTLKEFYRERKRLHQERKTLTELEPLLAQITQALGKNPDPIPVLVVSYNNGVYVQNTVEQVQRFGLTPIIIDNRSNDPATLKSLATIQASGRAQVIASPKNFGHLVGFLDPVYKLLPEVFAYTDPDLAFSPKLPPNFLSVLAELTVMFSTFKAGFALDLTADKDLLTANTTIKTSKLFQFQKTYSIAEWESQFWRRRLAHPSLEIYGEKIDTTFAVYRKSNFRGDFFDAIRVAGDYSAIHLPWFPKLDLMSARQRQQYFNQNNNCSTWVRAA